MARSDPLGPLEDSLNESAILAFHRRVAALAEEGYEGEAAQPGGTASPRRASSEASDGSDTEDSSDTTHVPAATTPRARMPSDHYRPWLPADIRRGSDRSGTAASHTSARGARCRPDEAGSRGQRHRTDSRPRASQIRHEVSADGSSDVEDGQDNESPHGRYHDLGERFNVRDEDEPVTERSVRGQPSEEQRAHRLSASPEGTERRGNENSSPLDGDDPAEEGTDGKPGSPGSTSVSNYEIGDGDMNGSTSSNGVSEDETESDSSIGTIVPLPPSLMSLRAKGDEQIRLLVELNDVLERLLRLCLSAAASRPLGSSHMREIAQGWDMLVEVFNRVYPALHELRAPFHLMDWHRTQGFRLDLPLAFFIKNLTNIAPWGCPSASGTQEVPDTRMGDAVRLAASRDAGRFSFDIISLSDIHKTLELLEDARACSGRSDAVFNSTEARRLHAKRMGISVNWMGVGGSVDVWPEAD